MRRSAKLGIIVVLAALGYGDARGGQNDVPLDPSATSAVPADCVGEPSLPSTLALIEQAVFEDRSCTLVFCHGSVGLDLSPGVSHGQLVGVPATTWPELDRVSPGRLEESLLWLNVAAKSLPDTWRAPVRPMPIEPLAALSSDAIGLLRHWMRAGAPELGVVPGSENFLDVCLSAPGQIAMPEFAPPPPGDGLELSLPRSYASPMSESEVCMATYFDVSEQEGLVIEGNEGGFRYGSLLARYNPHVSRAAAYVYDGTASPDDAAWGAFRCRGGAAEGLVCAPMDVGFCGDGVCATDPVAGISCSGFGPADLGIDQESPPIFMTGDGSVAAYELAEGVYGEMPTKGMLIWNVRAVNPTAEPVYIDARVSFAFAPPSEQRLELRQFRDLDGAAGFNVPAFSAGSVCDIQVLPQGAQVFELRSLLHRRATAFRLYRGPFTCAGGPSDGTPCSPERSAAELDRCAGAPCESALGLTAEEARLPVGDASFDEPLLLRCDSPAEFEARVGACAALQSLLPSDAVRSLTFCASYDNGLVDVRKVKRRSTSPAPCLATHCTAGQVTQPCSGATAAERDASCDSEPDLGDGECDACTLSGGFSSDDAALGLVGQYFIPPTTPAPTASPTARPTGTATATATSTATSTSTPPPTATPSATATATAAFTDTAPPAPTSPATATAGAASPTASVEPTSPPCTGNCDGGPEVTVAELIRGVRIALGEAPLDLCPPFDANGDGRVAINELIAAVNNALYGCGATRGEIRLTLRPAAAV